MTNSLVIFTKAARMLAEANTIQKAKDLKNLALTAADWARRKDMGKRSSRKSNLRTFLTPSSRRHKAIVGQRTSPRR